MHHAVDLVLRQTALVVRDRDVCRTRRAHVLRRHVQDVVRLDVERHLDLRNASRRWRDSVQFELTY